MQLLTSSITISFTDGSPSLVLEKADAEKVELIARSLFHGMQASQTFTCSGCSATLFKNCLAIMSEGKSFEEVLSRKQRQKADLCDRLIRAASYLYPIQSAEMKPKILDYFATLSLAQANSFVYQGQAIPFSYGVAQKTRLDALYFDDPAKAAVYFDQLKSYRQAYAKAQKEGHKEEKKVLKRKLANHQARLIALKQSPAGLANASRSISNSHLFISQEALKAQEKLQIYSKKIEKALANNGADMTRHDLLEHIIGPKNYLFSHYGIVPNDKQAFLAKGAKPIEERWVNGGLISSYADEDWRYSVDTKFSHFPSASKTCQYRKVPSMITMSRGLDYSLKNNLSPYDLEEEMRSDLEQQLKYQRSAFELPKRLIEDKTITYPVTAALTQLKAQLAPSLKNWSQLPLAAQQKSLAALIHYNQWDPYGIKPEAIQLIKSKKIKESSFKVITGTLTLDDKVRKIYFNTVNYLLIIKDLPYTNPDSICAHQYLSKLMKKSKVEPLT